jgi:hypothetical protein
MRIWLLHGNQMVTGQFLQYSNYHIRFVADGNGQILKLPLLSNERGLISNITILLATLPLPFTDGITIYYHICTIKPTPFIWIAHACIQIPYARFIKLRKAN